jgi:hypothetical protein
VWLWLWVCVCLRVEGGMELCRCVGVCVMCWLPLVLFYSTCPALVAFATPGCLWFPGDGLSVQACPSHSVCCQTVLYYLDRCRGPLPVCYTSIP